MLIAFCFYSFYTWLWDICYHTSQKLFYSCTFDEGLLLHTAVFEALNFSSHYFW